MRFAPTPLAGVLRIGSDRHGDARGGFYRASCAAEFAAAGLPDAFVQTSVSENPQRGTLRGLHFQAAPHGEGKLVRCLAGRVFDVVVDLRPGSPTLHRWHAEELSATGMTALFIPPGCAHGFQTLTDDVVLLYQMTVAYVPGAASGVRWNDPAFGITWPLADGLLSPRDASWPDVGA